MDVLATFIRTVRRFDLIRRGDRLLVAASGGGDSTALLHLLRSWEEVPFTLAVAHLDHGQRGEQGHADAEFVADLARAANLPFFSDRLTYGPLRSEERLRSERLLFLARTSRAWRATGVAMGHQRDDQAETVLLNLLRGAGSRGLGGMPPVSRLQVDGARLLRPLIAIPRAELHAWLAERGLPWREDASNSEARYLRNRIRHELLVLADDLRPGAAAAIARTAALLREDEDLLGDLASRRQAGVRVEGRAARLGVPALRELPAPLARRLLRRAVAEMAAAGADAGGLPGHPPWAPGAEQVEAVLERIRARRPGRVDLGQGWVAQVGKETIEIVSKSASRTRAPSQRHPPSRSPRST